MVSCKWTLLLMVVVVTLIPEVRTRNDKDRAGLFSRGISAACGLAGSGKSSVGQADADAAEDRTNSISVADDGRFAGILNRTKFKSVVVGFVRKSCDACQRTDAAVAGLAVAHAAVLFLRVDVDACAGTAFDHEAGSTPAFVFRKNGYEVGRYRGADEAALAAFAVAPPANAMRCAGDHDFSDKMYAESARTGGKEGDEPRLVVVYFYAEWCAGHGRMWTHVRDTAAAYPDVSFLLVDVDACRRIAGSYHVTALPTFVFRKADGIMETLTAPSEQDVTVRARDLRNVPPADDHDRAETAEVTRNEDLKPLLAGFGDGPVVVCFCRRDCIACRDNIKNHVTRFPGLGFLRVAVDTCDKARTDYGIVHTPTFVYRRANREVGRMTSAKSWLMKPFVDRCKAVDRS